MYRDDFDAHSFVQQFLGPGNANHGDHFDSDSIQSKSIDLRVGLSRLNMSITEVDHKIHELMGQHSKAFIQRLGQIKQVRDTMASLNTEMQQIEETGTKYVAQLTPVPRKM